jgi:hypothetical protein
VSWEFRLFFLFIIEFLYNVDLGCVGWCCKAACRVTDDLFYMRIECVFLMCPYYVCICMYVFMFYIIL